MSVQKFFSAALNASRARATRPSASTRSTPQVWHQVICIAGAFSSMNERRRFETASSREASGWSPQYEHVAEIGAAATVGFFAAAAAFFASGAAAFGVVAALGAGATFFGV